MWFALDPARPGLWLAVGLLAGGALGNLADRVRADAVTDFIDPPLWPTFNLADVAITLGALALVLVSLDRRTPGRAASGRAADEAGAARHRPRGRVAGGRRQARRPRRPRRPRATAGRRSSMLLGELLGGGEDPERPGIVHRLDKDTSGLMLVARGDEAHRRLAAQIKAREVRAHLPGAGRGPSTLAHRNHRRPAGPRLPGPGAPSRGGRAPREARTHFTRASSCSQPMPSSRRAWRRAAPIRSAPTSRPSGIRSRATRATGTPGATASTASSCTAPGSGSGTRSRARSSSSSSPLPEDLAEALERARAA